MRGAVAAGGGGGGIQWVESDGFAATAAEMTFRVRIAPLTHYKVTADAPDGRDRGERGRAAAPHEQRERHVRVVVQPARVEDERREVDGRRCARHLRVGVREERHNTFRSHCCRLRSMTNLSNAMRTSASAYERSARRQPIASDASSCSRACGDDVLHTDLASQPLGSNRQIQLDASSCSRAATMSVTERSSITRRVTVTHRG